MNMPTFKIDQATMDGKNIFILSLFHLNKSFYYCIEDKEYSHLEFLAQIEIGVNELIDKFF